ncbi:unnamed protein product, partial [Ectocarpus sp. 12 AP-2014]
CIDFLISSVGETSYACPSWPFRMYQVSIVMHLVSLFEPVAYSCTASVGTAMWTVTVQSSSYFNFPSHLKCWHCTPTSAQTSIKFAAGTPCEQPKRTLSQR